MYKLTKYFTALLILIFSVSAFSADLAGAADFLSRRCEAKVTISGKGEMKIIGLKSWGMTHNFQFNIKDAQLRTSSEAGGLARITCKGGKNCMTTIEMNDTSGYAEKPPTHTFDDTVQNLTCQYGDGLTDIALTDIFLHFNGKAKKATIYD